MDGAVELEADGEAEAVERFRELLARGPRMAHVERVEDLDVSEDELPRPFSVAF
jgi:acylphosphatase